jgi:hypothetical protein
MRTRSRRSESSSGRAPVFEAQARPSRIVARFRRSGSVAERAVVGTDRGPWTRRARSFDWRAARAASLPSRFAGAAIAATSIAAWTARPSPVRSACDRPGVDIARVRKAASTIATESANDEGVAASKRPAWGITLPHWPRHRSESSPQGFRPHLPRGPSPARWRFCTMQAHRHRLLPPIDCAVPAVRCRLRTSPPFAPAGVHARALREAKR